MLGGIGRIRDLGNAFDWRRVRPLATPANANVLGLPAGQQRGTMDPRDVIRRSGEFTDPDEAIAFSHASGQKDINDQPIPRLSNLPKAGRGEPQYQESGANMYTVGRSRPGAAPSSRATDEFGPHTLRRLSTPAVNNQSSVTTEFTPQRYEGEQARGRLSSTADQEDSRILGGLDAFQKRWGAGSYQAMPTGATKDPDTRNWRNEPKLTRGIRQGEWKRDPRTLPDRGIGPVLRGEKDSTYVLDPNIANTAPSDKARMAWGEENPNVLEILQPREGEFEPETRAILEEYSRGLLNETDVRPETTSQLRKGLTEYQKDSFRQTPGRGTPIPRDYNYRGSELVGGINAYGPVQMQYRTIGADGREKIEIKNVYPDELIDRVEVNPDATYMSDQFKEPNLGNLVQEARWEAATPLIGRTELTELWREGRFIVPSSTPGNLVGYMKGKDGKGGTPIYRSPVEGEQGSELFRVGVPTSMDFDLSRQLVADPRVSGSINSLSTRVKNVGGTRVEEGFVPYLNREDVYPKIGGLRRNKEKEPYGLKLSEAQREVAVGSNQDHPDLIDAYRRILASAAETGQMPIHVSGQKTTGQKPIRGTVESLRSGIDPITERRRMMSRDPGTDSPQVTAGKQLRAALLDHVEATGKPVPQQEAIQWASVIGSRWGIDANSVLTAAAARTPDPSRLTRVQGVADEATGLGQILENAIAQGNRTIPANDPGRALFRSGSNAERMLEQSVRERHGVRVELDSEPPIADAAGNPIPTGARSQRKIDKLLDKLRTQEGEGFEKITQLAASGKLDSEETEILTQFLLENPRGVESDRALTQKGFSVTPQEAPVSDAAKIAMRYVGDPLGNPEEMKRAMYLGEVAEREFAARVQGAWEQARDLGRGASMEDIINAMGREETLESIVAELVTPSPVVRYERPDPIQAEATRQRYQNYIPGASEIGGLKYPFQEGGYDRLADALGEEPGTPRHDAAMAHLVQRMQARQAGGETRGQYADKIAISEQASGVPQQLNLGVVSTDDSTDQLAAPAPQPVIDQTAPGVPLDNTPGVAELASTISSQRPQGRRPPDAPPLYRAGEIIPDELHNELLAQHLAKARGLI